MAACLCMFAVAQVPAASSCVWRIYIDSNIFSGEQPETLGDFDSLSLCQETCATAASFACFSVMYYTDTYT